MNLKDYRQKLMQDPETEAAYQELRPKLELGRQVLDLRLERGWTQKELAKKAGTKQANISRLENALINPSIGMLQKVANALGVRLEIQLVPEVVASLADQPSDALEIPSSVAASQDVADVSLPGLLAVVQGSGPRALTTLKLGDGAKVLLFDSTDEPAVSDGEEAIPMPD